MTVTNPANKTIVLGNGATTSFTFNFVAVSAASIQVIYTDPTGNTTVLAPASYGLTLNAPPSGQLWALGGTVVYPLTGAPIVNGASITIERVLPITQAISVQNQTALYLQVIEQALDTLTMIVQQQQELLGRGLAIPTSDLTGTSTTFLPAALRANQIVGFDPAGNATLYPIGSGYTGLASAINFTQTGTGAVTRTVLAKLQERLSVADYYLVSDPDDTASILRAFAAIKLTGGTMEFPRRAAPYVCSGWDISGTCPYPVLVEGNGATIIPATVGQNAILSWDNHLLSGGYAGSNMRFRNLNLYGRVAGSSSSGDVNYCLYGNGGGSVFDNVSFAYGIIAGFYGFYAQYCEFYGCLFSACAANGASTGCLFDGNTASFATNEIIMVRPRFFSNANHLWIKGGMQYGIHRPTFQAQLAVSGAGGALVLSADGSGYYPVGVHVHDPYFEVNQTRDIYNSGSQGARIYGATFASNAQILTNNCYDLGFIDCIAYAAMACNINHPSGNADTASLTFENNNWIPTLGLAHNGPTQIAGQSAASGLSYNLNILQSVGVNDNGVLAAAVPAWSGAKAAVAKATTTPIFSITLDTAGDLKRRAVVLKLHLDLIDDSSPDTQFGYGAHVGQTTNVFITCNNSGTPQVFTAADQAGTDLGVSPSFQAPGVSTVTTAVSGNTITFSINFPGAGTGGTPQACAFYRLEGVGINPFYLSQL